LRVSDRCQPEEKAERDEDTAARCCTIHRNLLPCSSNCCEHAGSVERGCGSSLRSGAIIARKGFDHGVGHSLLLLYDAKAPYSQNSKYFNVLGHHPFNAIYKFIIN